MDAIALKLLKKPVIYRGRVCLITSTYDDGTVDVDDGIVNYPDVRLNELRTADMGC